MLTKRKMKQSNQVTKMNGGAEEAELQEHHNDDRSLIDDDGVILTYEEDDDELSIESADSAGIVECGTEWSSIGASSKKPRAPLPEDRTANSTRMEADAKAKEEAKEETVPPQKNVEDEADEEDEYEDIVVDLEEVLEEAPINEPVLSSPSAVKQKADDTPTPSQKEIGLGPVKIDSKTLPSISILLLCLFATIIAIWQGLSWRHSALRLEAELHRLRAEPIPTPPSSSSFLHDSMDSSSNQDTNPTMEGSSWKFNPRACWANSFSSLSLDDCATEVADSAALATRHAASFLRDAAMAAWNARTEANKEPPETSDQKQDPTCSKAQQQQQQHEHTPPPTFNEMWNTFLSDVTEKGIFDSSRDLLENATATIRQFLNDIPNQEEQQQEEKTLMDEASELLTELAAHSLQSFNRWTNTTSTMVSSKAKGVMQDLRIKYNRQKQALHLRETFSRWYRESLSNTQKAVEQTLESSLDRIEQVADSLLDHWTGDEK